MGIRLSYELPENADTTPVTSDRLVAFDLETTGVDTLSARIVTSSLIYVERRDDGTWDTWQKNRLADPGIEIPEGAAAVHGVTTEMARANGQPHDEVLAGTIADIHKAWDAGAILVAFNAAYDLSMLCALDPDFVVRGPVFDPLIVDKALDRFRRGGRKLTDIAALYGVPLSEEDAHDSFADAIAAGKLATRMINDHLPKAGGAWAEALESTATLMDRQRSAAFVQRKGLQEYFDRKGQTAEIDLGWPVEDRVMAARRAARSTITGHLPAASAAT